MITVVKETNYFHPDMHLYNQGMTQDEIMDEFTQEMVTKNVMVNSIRSIGDDGKEYITHISYTGNAVSVNEACSEHDIIEEENA